MSDFKIGVVGAGVVGIVTAIELQKQYRNAEIIVVADKFLKETTSYVAAGLFRPGISFSGPNETITRKWISDAYEYWDGLRITEEALNVGILELSGYLFSNISPRIVRNAYIEKLVPLYRVATEDEKNRYPGDWKYGSFFITLLIECGLFLPWATNKFLHLGGKILEEQVQALSNLVEKYDVVVNCTGLGAKHLCDDNKLVPIRGQVLKIHAPWLKTFLYADFDTYIIPGFEAVTLGGCRQYESYNLNWCRYDECAIRERCEALLPSLRSTKVVGRRLGLRPHRDPVRVEKEVLRIAENKYKIVHNYGHGGYGVTTAPGTAKHAVELVREIFIGNSKL